MKVDEKEKKAGVAGDKSKRTAWAYTNCHQFSIPLELSKHVDNPFFRGAFLV